MIATGIPASGERYRWGECGLTAPLCGALQGKRIVLNTATAVRDGVFPKERSRAHCDVHSEPRQPHQLGAQSRLNCQQTPGLTSPCRKNRHFSLLNTSIVAEKMLHQQEVQENEEALQKSPDDVPEEAAGRGLVGDIQEEFCPLLSDSQEEHTECEAKELLQHDEPEEEESPQEHPIHAEEEAVEEPLVSCSQEVEPPQGEQHKEHLEVTVNVAASIHSHDSAGQATGSPQSLRSGTPEGSCFLTDRKELLEKDSGFLIQPEELYPGAGTPSGYLPYYRTCGHLPPCQFQDREEVPTPPCRADASIQVRGSSPDKARRQEGGAEADSSREGSQVKPHPDKWPLSPSLEEASGRNRKGQEVAKRREQPAPAPSCPPAPSSSQRGVNNLLQWVRNIFSWPSLARPPPSPAPAEEGGRGHLGSRFRGWLRKHRGRVYPQSR